MALLVPILQMIIANEESKQKSIRIRAARDHYRDEYFRTERKLTAMCPAWLTLADDQITWIEHENVIAAIVSIHELYLDGKSVSNIVRILNEDRSIWQPEPHGRNSTGGWRESFVRSLLGDPRLIGHYQFHVKVKKDEDDPTSPIIRKPIGEVIPDYYPKVIDEGLWQQVRDIRDSNAELNKGHGGGRTWANKNLFVHMIKCKECGGPLHLDHKRPEYPYSQYLFCDQKRRALSDVNGKRICNAPNLRYLDVEKAFFTRFSELDIDALMTKRDELQSRIEGTKAQLAVLSRKESDLQENIENFTTAIGLAKTARNQANLASKLDDAYIKLDEVEEDIKYCDKRLTDLQEERTTLKEEVRLTDELYALLSSTPENELPELRKRIHNQIRTWVKKITVLPAKNHGRKESSVKAIRIFFHDGYSQSLITNWMEK